MRAPQAREGLLSALEDPDWNVRSHTGWGLVYLGETVREDVIRIAQTSKNPDARLETYRRWCEENGTEFLDFRE